MALIGPAAAGKNTLGALLATMTGREFADIDAVGEAYYAEAGWTLDRLRQPARAHAVEQIVRGHPGAKVAFGAVIARYQRPGLAEQVRAAPGPVDHVVLVLPSPAAERSVQILRERGLTDKGTNWIQDGHDFLRQWVTDSGNRVLATTVRYTDREKLEQIAARLR
jgi:hypothetical protein